MRKVVFYILCFFMLIAFCAPFLSVQNLNTLKPLYLQNNFIEPFTMPYLLGTDMYGQDLLSGILFGLRMTFFVCGMATLTAFALGTFLGLFAGLKGGLVMRIIARVIDLSLSLPTILLALIFVGFFKGGFWALYFSLVIGGWGYFARSAMAASVVEAQKSYVEGARFLGRSSFFIVMRHLLPNCLWATLSLVPAQFAHGIMIESGLPFLGVQMGGFVSSLGTLMHRGFEHLLSGHPWVFLFPFSVLFIILICLGFLSERTSLRE